jgi:hypothetical protein
MSIEERVSKPLSHEIDKMVNGSLVAATQVAVQNARRAADHAVMAIFELAFLLESLDDIIGRYNAETERQVGNWTFPERS